jgi:hypothetical protein
MVLPSGSLISLPLRANRRLTTALSTSWSTSRFR